jgi:hypothetical protein
MSMLLPWYQCSYNYSLKASDCINASASNAVNAPATHDAPNDALSAPRCCALAPATDLTDLAVDSGRWDLQQVKDKQDAEIAHQKALNELQVRGCGVWGLGFAVSG